jgi:hemerythrin superfamily protein
VPTRTVVSVRRCRASLCSPKIRFVSSLIRRSSRDVWIGFAAGFVLSRVIPSVWAQVRGAAGSAVGEDPFVELIRQHRILLSLLDRMEQTPADATARRAFLFLAFKRTIAKHALAEEDVAYPLLYAEAGRRETAEKLYREHADMKIHLFALQQKMREEEGWKEHVRALRDEIAGHARQEEDEVFPQLRELRQARESSVLSRNLRQEEAFVV